MIKEERRKRARDAVAWFALSAACAGKPGDFVEMVALFNEEVIAALNEDLLKPFAKYLRGIADIAERQAKKAERRQRKISVHVAKNPSYQDGFLGARKASKTRVRRSSH